MYFHSRHQAGQMLASKIVSKYRYENCVVICLDDGGAVVGAEIARRLHCGIFMSVNEQINLPQEPVAVGGLTLDGEFVTNNSQYSKADLDELVEENRGYIEQQRIEKFHEINRLVNSYGAVDKRVLTGHNIILASDGLKDSFKLDMALAFMKTVRYKKVVVAAPLASVKVVDWMHVNSDEIYCLSIVEEYSDTNHYYDINDVPDHEALVKILSNNILNWS
jgi:putative phosphoribosyl transferase